MNQEQSNALPTIVPFAIADLHEVGKSFISSDRWFRAFTEQDRAGIGGNKQSGQPDQSGRPHVAGIHPIASLMSVRVIGGPWISVVSEEQWAVTRFVINQYGFGNSAPPCRDEGNACSVWFLLITEEGDAFRMLTLQDLIKSQHGASVPLCYAGMSCMTNSLYLSAQKIISNSAEFNSLNHLKQLHVSTLESFVPCLEKL